ncbi:hypothetical protein At1D132_46010 (plasmid) [Agrobacterium fabrum]|jgi:hypothetical protein|nr:hypothetical protein At1D132_46010 [Agrobacterium fabrum]
MCADWSKEKALAWPLPDDAHIFLGNERSGSTNVQTSDEPIDPSSLLWRGINAVISGTRLSLGEG